MKLLTQEIIDKMPPLYSGEDLTDDKKKIICKFFTPWSNWTWYVLEGSLQKDGDWLFFGYVCGLEDELGYFSLNELSSVKGPFGLAIERDLHFADCTLKDVLNKVYV